MNDFIPLKHVFRTFRLLSAAVFPEKSRLRLSAGWSPGESAPSMRVILDQLRGALWVYNRFQPRKMPYF